MLWALAFDAVIFGLLPAPISLVGAFVIVSVAAIVAFADDIIPHIVGLSRHVFSLARTTHYASRPPGDPMQPRPDNSGERRS
jgi:hypothetical protein